jgi:phage baseplate assembly protein W
MAVIDLNNFVNPKKTFNPSTEDFRVVNKPKPVYTDLHLDLTYAKNVGVGLNPAKAADILVDADIEAIKNAIRNIFTTKKGQKILNPDFGSSLDQYLFTPITEANAKAMGNQILNDVLKYEPRITISNVLINPIPDRNYYYIAIYYTLNDIKKENTINLIAELGGQISLAA